MNIKLTLSLSNDSVQRHEKKNTKNYDNFTPVTNAQN